MLLGPVFHFDLLAMSRRRRHYAMRVVYGLFLLAVLANSNAVMGQFAGNTRWGESRLLTFMALQFSEYFIGMQVGLVLLISPAMVGATIAGDRQRKILDDLLTSQLSSAEIVVGKLASRLLGIVGIVLVGLPILSLIGLLGGVDPAMMAVAVGGTMTTAFLVGALSIFVSALSRRGRDAVIVSYLAVLVLFVVPRFLHAGATGPAPIFPVWLDMSVGGATDIISPFRLASLAEPPPGLLSDVATMAAAQVGLGLVFMGLAIVRLRPSAAKGDRVPRRAVSRRVRRRRPVGGDPMLWKEIHTARMGRIVRALVVVAGVAALVASVVNLQTPVRLAFEELAVYGYGDAPSGVIHQARNDLNVDIVEQATLVYIVWTIGLAATVAAGVSGEREGDTWISLIATPVTGWEILRGKALGALWRWRWVGFMAVGLWTLGFVAGAIHPIGYAATLAAFVACTGVTVALASFVSIRSTSTTKAITTTMVALVLINFGPTILNVVTRQPFGLLYTTNSPFLIETTAASYRTIQSLFGSYPLGQLHSEIAAANLMTCVVGIFGYAVVTVSLGAWTVNDFDRVADRPRRPLGWRIPPDDGMEPLS